MESPRMVYYIGLGTDKVEKDGKVRHRIGNESKNKVACKQ